MTDESENSDMEPVAERLYLWSRETSMQETELFKRFQEWSSNFRLGSSTASLLFEAFAAGYEFGVMMMELPGGTRVLRQD